MNKKKKTLQRYCVSNKNQMFIPNVVNVCGIN